MKKIYTLALLLIATMAAMAQSFIVDNISYQVTNANEVEVVPYASGNANMYTSDVVVPETVTNAGTTYTVTSIGQTAFAMAQTLTSVSLPKTVTTIGMQAFLMTPSLTKITVDAANPALCSVDGVLFSKDKTVLIACPGGKEGIYTIPDGVKTIGMGAIGACIKLTSVVMPASVTTIGIGGFIYDLSLESIIIGSGVKTIGEEAFSTCKKLKGVVIPQGVTTIADKVFYGCESLGSATVPESVTTFGKAVFQGCSALRTAKLPSSLKAIPDYTFFRCSSLESFDFPTGVEAIGEGAFSSCSQLTSVVLPEALKTIGDESFEYSVFSAVDIPDGVTHIGNYAFGYSNNLTSVTLPKNLSTTGYRCFEGCSSLASVVVSSGVLGERVFSNCNNLTDATINMGVTEIGEGAFELCNLKEITLPATVTAINMNAFAGNTSLKTINLGAGVTNILHEAFVDCPADEVTCLAKEVPAIAEFAFSNYGTLHVLPESLSAYENDATWANFNILGDASIPSYGQCEKPVVTVKNGVVSASCTTPGAVFHYVATPNTPIDAFGPSFTLPTSYTVTVTAVATYYDESEGVSVEVPAGSAIKGDVNNDGKVSMLDANAVVNIFVNE